MPALVEWEGELYAQTLWTVGSSAGELNTLQAQCATQSVQIFKTEICAPFAGRVGIRPVSEGAFVSPATPLVTLQDV